MTRIFFCTDLHGSEICFRKFLHAGRVYEADVVIMGGDCTGKMVIPLVHSGNGTYLSEWGGTPHSLRSESELEEEEKKISNSGLYPVRVEEEECERLREDAGRRGQLFREVMIKRLERWVALAEERLSGEVRVIMTPGNDDDFEVDDVLEKSTLIEAAGDKVIRLDDRHEMLSVTWSNPTPWDTPRECSEEELSSRIRTLAARVEDMENAIFNIHVPPFGSGLDIAPEVADGNRVRRGGTVRKPVGSTAVRDAILEYQPLLSLHGHIHESRAMQRLGRTMSINPGSAYGDWALQGVIVDLDEKKVKRYVPVTG